MQRYADWIPFELKKDEQLSSCHISYGIRCAACGRTLGFGGLHYEGGIARMYCTLDTTWRRNAVGVYRRAKRAPRRKFEYTLPDGSKLAANLKVIVENGDSNGYKAMPFLIECDGKMLLDGRYVPCKERNIVDPYAAHALAEREVQRVA